MPAALLTRFISASDAVGVNVSADVGYLPVSRCPLSIGRFSVSTEAPADHAFFTEALAVRGAAIAAPLAQ